MIYSDLQLQFAESPTLRLLRAENAPLVLACLFSAFKREHHPIVPESRLRAILEAKLEELRNDGEGPREKSAKDYLVEWVDPSHSYLHRFQPQESDEPAYELTPEAERAFQWLETLKPRPHVGTESKFKSLAKTLEEIVENSTKEVDQRIQKLRAEQGRLQEQIDEIERTGVAPVYTATQINERFQIVLEIARRLLGDFREVERHFRTVTEDSRCSDSGKWRAKRSSKRGFGIQKEHSSRTNSPSIFLGNSAAHFRFGPISGSI